MARHPLLVALAIGLLGGLASAGEATIMATSSDVEVRRAASRQWVHAEDGMALSPGDVVATGYRAQAVLAFEGNAYMLVLPMTQLQVEQHGAEGNKSQTQVYLRIGSVRAKVPKSRARDTRLAVATPDGKTRVGSLECLVTHDEEFGTRVRALSGSSRARARKNAEVGVKNGQTARLVEKRARNARELDKERLAPDLTPIGTDETEREATRDYHRVDHRPVTDSTSANAVQEIAGVSAGDSALVFRYEVLSSQ